MQKRLFLFILFWLSCSICNVQLFICANVSGVCLNLDHRIFPPPWVSIAQKCGLDLLHLSLEDLLDNGIETFKRTEEVVFINLTDEFLASSKNSDSTTVNKILEILQKIGQSQPKVICLLLPMCFGCSEQAKESVAQICAWLRPDQPLEMQTINRFQQQVKAKTPYATALSTGTHTLELTEGAAINFWQQMSLFEPPVNPTSFVFLSGPIANTFGPGEDFRIFPIDRTLQSLLFNQVTNFFSRVTSLCCPEKNSNPRPSIEFEKFFQAMPQAIKPKHKSLKFFDHCLRVGWMEIDDFCSFAQEGEEILQAKEQFGNILIQAIVQGGIKDLWINFNPNVLFGINGIKQQSKEVFLRGLEKFAKQLKLVCDQEAVEMPKFLLGVEIGNNLVPGAWPKHPEQDLWGKVYPDLPCALDRDFWDQELINPCKDFFESWKANAQSKSFPVSAVVVDLEFYNRRHSGTFISSMGFGEKNLTMCNLDKEFTQSKERQGRSFKKCFKLLGKKANELGSYLACKFNSSGVKNLYFYVPTLDTNWFYANLFNGASCKSKCHIFSFVSRPDLYGSFFSNLKIQASVAPVFMLSKIADDNASVQTFCQVSGFSYPEGQNRVWFNRISRIGHPYDQDAWHKIEQSPTSLDKRINFLKKISNR